MAIQQYLDSALKVAGDFGLAKPSADENRFASLLEDLASVDEPKVAAIESVVRYTGTFAELIRDNVSDMRVSTRYGKIADRFNTIREDVMDRIEDAEDGKISFKENLDYQWMRLRRRSPATRFGQITKTYNDVAKDLLGQLQGEEAIIGAYQDFRVALKEAEGLAYDVFHGQEANLEAAKEAARRAQDAVAAYTGAQDTSAFTALQSARDQSLRALRVEDNKYQLAKDIAEHLKNGYNVGETLVARLQQTHEVKQRIYDRAVVFFDTQEHVFSMLSAIYTSTLGLHEGAKTLEVMAEGVGGAIRDAATIGDKVARDALEQGYGSMYQADDVKALVDSIVSFQEDSLQLIGQYRAQATQVAQEISVIVEDGKQRVNDALMRYLNAPTTPLALPAGN